MGDFARIVLAIFASSILLALALPPANVGILGWICLAPMLWAVTGRGLLWGFLGGMGVTLGAALWAQSGVFYVSKWPDGQSGWIFLGLTLYGIVISYTAIVLSESKRSVNALSIAGQVVLVEALLTLILPAHLALTQWQSQAAMTLTAVTGIWGVSLMVWWVNVGIAASLKDRRVHAPTFIPMAVMAVAWMARPAPGPVLKTIRVGVVQSDASDEARLLRLDSMANSRADVVVWPELAGVLFASGGDLTQLEKLAARSGTPFITSYEEPGTPLAANVARLFSPNSTSAPYVKRKPFAGERNIHRAGTKPVAVTLKLRDGSDISAGINICFDTCYPWIMRETRESMSGPGVILVPTEDPPTMHGVVPSLHAAYNTFRAAELATPIVRAENTDASMAVDDLGHVIEILAPGEASMTVSVPIRSARVTLYQRFGEWLLWADLLALGIWLFIKRRKLQEINTPD